MRTELDYHTFEQPIIRNNAELTLEIPKCRVNDASRRHIPKRRATTTNLSWINNDFKQAIGRRQRAYEIKRRISNEETVAEYIAAKRQVKRIVKQEKRNKELSIARICKHNPKSVYSYINERGIVRDNIRPLKTLEGFVITTQSEIYRRGNVENDWNSSVVRRWQSKAIDRKSTRLNSSHSAKSRMPSSA